MASKATDSECFDQCAVCVPFWRSSPREFKSEVRIPNNTIRHPQADRTVYGHYLTFSILTGVQYGFGSFILDLTPDHFSQFRSVRLDPNLTINFRHRKTRASFSSFISNDRAIKS